MSLHESYKVLVALPPPSLLATSLGLLMVHCRVTEQERALEEQAMAMEKLSAKLQQYNEEEVKEEVRDC